MDLYKNWFPVNSMLHKRRDYSQEIANVGYPQKVVKVGSFCGFPIAIKCLALLSSLWH